MKKILYLSIFLLPFVSCAPYYAPPAHTPPVLEKEWDMNAGLNASRNFGRNEFGFKGSLLGPKNIFAQFDWQKGEFSDIRSSYAEDWRHMNYQYNEISTGYFKDFGKSRLLAAAYYGFGAHHLRYLSWPYPSGYKEYAYQSARMQQVGLNTSFYFEFGKKWLAVGSVRFHQFRLANVKRLGNFNNMMLFDDVRQGYILAPSYTLIYKHDFFHTGIHSDLFYDPMKKLSDVKQYTISFVFGFNFNAAKLIKMEHSN